MVPLDSSGACFDVGSSTSPCGGLVVSGLSFQLSHSYSTELSTEVATRFNQSPNRKKGLKRKKCVFVLGRVGGGHQNLFHYHDN